MFGNSTAKTASEDRRIAKTRAALHDAVTMLLLDRSPGEISVQDILDHANVGRSTFYAHFNGKQEALESVLDELSECLEECDHVAFSIAIFRHSEKHRDLYRAIAGRTPCAHALRSWLEDAVCKRIASGVAAGAYGRDIAPTAFLAMASAAFTSLLFWSLDATPTPLPGALDAMFWTLVDKSRGVPPRGVLGNSEIRPK